MSMRMAIVMAASITGVLLFGNGAWLYGKAQLAQLLLARAWSRTLRGATEVRPWAWADTWPVAQIEFPRQHAKSIVLAGASGRTMAFAPGHVDGTAMPGEPGNCAISAHRDTQFAVLRDVDLGDDVIVERRDGVSVRYRVCARRIVDERDTSVLASSQGRRLTLITCYPFDALTPGGHWRYVVVAAAR